MSWEVWRGTGGFDPPPTHQIPLKPGCTRFLAQVSTVCLKPSKSCRTWWHTCIITWRWPGQVKCECCSGVQRLANKEEPFHVWWNAKKACWHARNWNAQERSRLPRSSEALLTQEEVSGHSSAWRSLQNLDGSSLTHLHPARCPAVSKKEV